MNFAKRQLAIVVLVLVSQAAFGMRQGAKKSDLPTLSRFQDFQSRMNAIDTDFDSIINEYQEKLTNAAQSKTEQAKVLKEYLNNLSPISVEVSRFKQAIEEEECTFDEERQLFSLYTQIADKKLSAELIYKDWVKKSKNYRKSVVPAYNALDAAVRAYNNKVGTELPAFIQNDDE